MTFFEFLWHVFAFVGILSVLVMLGLVFLFVITERGIKK